MPTVAYNTESRTSVEYSWTYDEGNSKFIGWKRTRTETSERQVFTGATAQDDAEAAVEAAVSDATPLQKSDGVARRCSDCGWWEAVIVTITVTEWEQFPENNNQ